jgi:hypothetical protein
VGTCARGHRSFDSAGLCRTILEVEPGLYAYHVGECDELASPAPSDAGERVLAREKGNVGGDLEQR